MRIFDTVLITSGRDLPLLEARFAELADLDVVHVICESPAAYDGTVKPTHFIENRDRFPHGRWNHVRIEPGELPDAEPALRKDALREYLFLGITSEPGDLILHGGADEIPSAQAVAALGPGIPPSVLEMRMCAYSPSLVHPDPWPGTVAARREDVTSLSGLRKTRRDLPVIRDAGTRLALMGEPGQESYPDGKALERREIDGTWPRWVREGRHPASWRQ